MARTLQDYKELNRLVDEIFQEAAMMGWPWIKLAEKSKLAISTVYNLGNEKTIYPRAATVVALAKAVGFNIVLEKKVRLKLRA